MKLENRVYDSLKWIALIGIPALSVLVCGIAKIWNLPCSAEIVQTLDIVGVFIGSLIGISTASYNEGKKK